jgi:hypothetical protein
MKRYYVDTRYCEEVDDTQLSPTRYERIMVLASDYDAAVKELVEALYETLDKIMWFRIWFEDEYIQHVEVDDPLLGEVARVGLNGRAETTLDKYEEGA